MPRVVESNTPTRHFYVIVSPYFVSDIEAMSLIALPEGWMDSLKSLWRINNDINVKKSRCQPTQDCQMPDKNFETTLIFKLWSSGKGQARIDKGWQSRQKASKLKPLPRAYTKVGCHPPPTTTTTTHRKSQYSSLMAWWWPGEAGRGKGRCVGSLWVTLGSL